MTRKVITTYEKLSNEVKEAINVKYPDGVEDEIKSITDVIKGGAFKGFIFDFNDTTYLIKFSVNTVLEHIDSDDDHSDDDGDYADEDTVVADADDYTDDSYDD
jgi:hypothetical protein